MTLMSENEQDSWVHKTEVAKNIHPLMREIAMRRPVVDRDVFRVDSPLTKRPDMAESYEIQADGTIVKYHYVTDLPSVLHHDHELTVDARGLFGRYVKRSQKQRSKEQKCFPSSLIPDVCDEENPLPAVEFKLVYNYELRFAEVQSIRLVRINHIKHHTIESFGKMLCTDTEGIFAKVRESDWRINYLVSKKNAGLFSGYVGVGSCYLLLSSYELGSAITHYANIRSIPVSEVYAGLGIPEFVDATEGVAAVNGASRRWLPFVNLANIVDSVAGVEPRYSAERVEKYHDLYEKVLRAKRARNGGDALSI